MPEVSSEDSSSKSKNAITREKKSRSVELGRKEFPTWRVTDYAEVIPVNATAALLPDCRQSGNCLPASRN